MIIISIVVIWQFVPKKVLLVLASRHLSHSIHLHLLSTISSVLQLLPQKHQSSEEVLKMIFSSIFQEVSASSRFFRASFLHIPKRSRYDHQLVVFDRTGKGKENEFLQTAHNLCRNLLLLDISITYTSSSLLIQLLLKEFHRWNILEYQDHLQA